MSELLARYGEQQTAAFFLVLARLGPLFVLAPFFSSRQFSFRAKGIAAVGLAIGMSPIAARGGTIPLDALGLSELMAKEILVGLAFAFAVAAVAAAVTSAGHFLDLLSGFSYGSLVDPLTGNNSAILSQAYGFIGVLTFIIIGGDVLVLRGLARTYDLVPLLAFPALDQLTAGMVTAFTGIFRAALELAAPVVLALIITDVAFGVLSRVVPQLNVFAVGAPAKIAVCLLVMGASLTFLGTWMGAQVEQAVADALRSLVVR